MITKQCTKCKETKPATNNFFSRHKTNGDRLNCWCKKCCSESIKSTFNSWGSGVYEIVNLITGDNYVGCSVELKRRRNTHLSIYSDPKNKVTNSSLQADVAKYSADAFEFFILEKLPKDKNQLEKREKYWINKLKPTYNIK